MGLFGGGSAGKYSEPQCKANLKMAIGRSKIVKNKTAALTKSIQRDVATLLKDGEENRARIKAEQVIQNMNMNQALDLLETYCDLLSTRISFVTQERSCPPDLEMTVATVLYCCGRVQVEELMKIRDNFLGKYGQQWIDEVVPSRVNPDIIRLLDLKPPTPAEVTVIMEEAALFYKVDWKPVGGQPQEPMNVNGIVAPPPVVNVVNPAPAASSSSSSSVAPVVVPVPVGQMVIKVVIPPGYAPGMQMPIQMPDGTQLAIILPANVAPGMTIDVPYNPQPVVMAQPVPVQPVAVMPQPPAPVVTVSPTNNNDRLVFVNGGVVAPPQQQPTNFDAPPQVVVAPDPSAGVNNQWLPNNKKYSDIFGWLLHLPGDKVSDEEVAKADGVLKTHDGDFVRFVVVYVGHDNDGVPIERMRELCKSKCLGGHVGFVYVNNDATEELYKNSVSKLGWPAVMWSEFEKRTDTLPRMIIKNGGLPYIAILELGTLTHSRNLMEDILYREAKEFPYRDVDADGGDLPEPDKEDLTPPANIVNNNQESNNSVVPAPGVVVIEEPSAPPANTMDDLMARFEALKK